MAITLSLCMIVKNEEAVLERCLASAAPLADEIILVDTGSEDQTETIARRYTDRVYCFPWKDDFAAARNFAFSKASMQYCIWLDADDVILPDQLARFQKLKEELAPDTDVVMLPYHIAEGPDHQPTVWYYRERIVRNSTDYRWCEPVHEVIVPHGKVVYGDAAVLHRKMERWDKERNLRILKGVLARGETLSPRLAFYYGRELFEHDRIAEAIAVLEDFWQNPQGWSENKIEACRVLGACYRAQGKTEAACQALLRSLVLDSPRAEICCDLGQIFLEQGRYETAAYWYEAARTAPDRTVGGGITLEDCRGFLPCIQLCVCYDRMGDLARAASYHQMAGTYRPQDPAYLANQAYFSRVLPAENQKGE